MKYSIGVDIGGTNTDAVLLDEKKDIIAFAKSPTTKSIVDGFFNVLSALFSKTTISLDNIEAVFVGTTHVTNAILEKKDLYKVGLIRIAGHFPDSIPPCFEWDEDLKSSILIDHVTINGGYECDGNQISPFDENEAKKAVLDLIDKGAKSIAVISVFSPMYNDLEKKTFKIIKKIAGKNFPISLSHEIGSVGFIERENSTILNAALQKSLKFGFQNLQAKLNELSIKAPLFLTQNNGSILSLDKALEYPILTISSGPTNSFMGASSLAKLKSCIVVDIGGTSTDIGIIKNGFIKRSLNLSKIGGVSLNFSMPDVLSVAIGGGSHILLNEKEVKIGPQSVGKNLTNSSICFGGKILTLTDVAVVLNSKIISAKNKIEIHTKKAEKILFQAFEKIKLLISQIEGKEQNLPIIIVGGGSILFENILPSKRFNIPKYHEVANAYGAALAKVSAEEDVIVSLNNRKKILKGIMKKATQKAIADGADPLDVEIVDIQIIPYHYVPNNLARVVITAAGRRQ